MKILDFRLRPPFGGIENSILYNYDYARSFAAMFHQDLGDSVKEKSMDLLLKEMDQAGVTHGVIPFRNMYGSNQDLVNALATTKEPERFFGLANFEIAPGEKDFPDNWEEELDKFVINGPLTGVGLEPSNWGACVDDERIFKIYEKCEKENLSVVLTSNTITPDDFSPFRVSNVLRTFPKLKVVLIHACMGWTSQVCQQAFMHPNLYLSPDCYLLNCPGYRDFIDAANTLTPEQIIFGSAYPLVPLDYAVQFYLNCGFRDDVIEDVMYYNGMRALGLEKHTNRCVRLNMYGA